MSRIIASIALAAAFAVPALAAEAKNEFNNVQLESQNVFKPEAGRSALTVPTEKTTVTYSGGDLFSSSITDVGSSEKLELNFAAPDAGSAFASGEAAKSVLTQQN